MTPVLPTFLVIGAQKAGTTSLHGYLARHPDVFVAEQKELNFFTDLEYHRGLEWYAGHFSAGAGAAARGDVSPLYTAHPWLTGVPKRVAAVLPGVKLVYLLRHPVERTLSNYRYHVALGIERMPMEQAIFEGNPAQYLHRSLYSLQIEQWLPHIDLSDLLIVTSEALRADHAGTMARIFRHVGVDPDAPLSPAPAERNRTDEIRLDRPGAALVRRSRLYPVLQSLVPAAARHAVWRAVGSRQEVTDPSRLVATEALRFRILETVRPDLERLPGYAGADFPCWGLLGDRPGSPAAT